MLVLFYTEVIHVTHKLGASFPPHLCFMPTLLISFYISLLI